MSQIFADKITEFPYNGTVYPCGLSRAFAEFFHKVGFTFRLAFTEGFQLFFEIGDFRLNELVAPEKIAFRVGMDLTAGREWLMKEAAADRFSIFYRLLDQSGVTWYYFSEPHRIEFRCADGLNETQFPNCEIDPTDVIEVGFRNYIDILPKDEVDMYRLSVGLRSKWAPAIDYIATPSPKKTPEEIAAADLEWRNRPPLSSEEALKIREVKSKFEKAFETRTLLKTTEPPHEYAHVGSKFWSDLTELVSFLYVHPSSAPLEVDGLTESDSRLAYCAQAQTAKHLFANSWTTSSTYYKARMEYFEAAGHYFWAYQYFAPENERHVFLHLEGVDFAVLAFYQDGIFFSLNDQFPNSVIQQPIGWAISGVKEERVPDLPESYPLFDASRVNEGYFQEVTKQLPEIFKELEFYEACRRATPEDSAILMAPNGKNELMGYPKNANQFFATHPLAADLYQSVRSEILADAPWIPINTILPLKNEHVVLNYEPNHLSPLFACYMNGFFIPFGGKPSPHDIQRPAAWYPLRFPANSNGKETPSPSHLTGFLVEIDI